MFLVQLVRTFHFPCIRHILLRWYPPYLRITGLNQTHIHHKYLCSEGARTGGGAGKLWDRKYARLPLGLDPMTDRVHVCLCWCCVWIVTRYRGGEANPRTAKVQLLLYVSMISMNVLTKYGFCMWDAVFGPAAMSRSVVFLQISGSSNGADFLWSRSSSYSCTSDVCCTTSAQ